MRGRNTLLRVLAYPREFNTLMTKVHNLCSDILNNSNINYNYKNFNYFNWKLSIFSYSLWQKNYICRHVIAAAAKKDLATYSLKVINNALERKRKLVRP